MTKAHKKILNFFPFVSKTTAYHDMAKLGITKTASLFMLCFMMRIACKHQMPGLQTTHSDVVNYHNVKKKN